VLPLKIPWKEIHKIGRKFELIQLTSVVVMYALTSFCTPELRVNAGVWYKTLLQKDRQ
jgi:hypothetical protein